MGMGIAQSAVTAGLRTVVIDPAPAALVRAEEQIAAALRKGVARGRWSTSDADAASRRLTFATEPADMAGVDAVIEAVPEELDSKRAVLRKLAEVCGPQTLLATNTSSLLISAIGAGVPHSERVVGMHFFNPVPAMRLVEVVPGSATTQPNLAAARSLGERLGKRVIIAKDGIGFLVNRCGRPYIGEALRLLEEGLATVEQIDRICRMGGHFRMGPFELVDLIGLDVNLEIAESFWRQSYGEPRWRPSPLQARLVATGRRGRKSRAGFYEYGKEPHRADDPEPPAVGGGDGRIVVLTGGGPVADGLRRRAAGAGFEIRGRYDTSPAECFLEVDADPQPRVQRGGPRADVRAVLCAGSSLGAIGDPRACAFHVLPPVADARLVELTSAPGTEPEAVWRSESFFGALGLHAEKVGDAPGLALGRIVAQLFNEAAFAIGEAVGSARDVDAGATLGLNHPRGPIA